MHKLLLASTIMVSASMANAATPATSTTSPAPTTAVADYTPTCTSGTPNSAASAGGFATLDGQIYTPGGQPFVAKGINVGLGDIGNASQMLADFPGLNFIRLAVSSDADPANLPAPSTMAAFIQTMTAHGVVVEIEDHPWGSGSSPQPDSYTGQQLTKESNWYASVASYYKTNPYVWFGTMNEPESGNAGIMQAQVDATYNAIRGAGNNSPIMVEAGVGGGNAGTVGDGGGYGGPGSGYTASDFANMTNVIWDFHFYGSGGSFATDPTAIMAALQGSAASHSGVAAMNTITDADGQIPIIVGETGDSVENNTTGGDQTLQVAFTSNLVNGAVAWAWDPAQASGNAAMVVADDLTDGNGNLSSYGQLVAGYIAAGGATGCAQAAIAPAITTLPSDYQSPSLSVAQVAALAASGQTSGDPATTGDGTLPPSIPSPTRTVASPTGTMPTPNPVSGSTSVNAAGNNQTVVASAGNGTGAVSGTGNTVNATGGAQTVTVSGTGNTITTGPYNDTVTLTAGGNTINTGGGYDTIVLAYNGQQPSSTINADVAALPPLAGAGNIFVAPPPGTGTLTIQGTMAQGDKIDLTTALAGTTWNGLPSTMWQYVTAAASPSGCTISVGDQVIVQIPGGSPSGNIGPFIVASH